MWKLIKLEWKKNHISKYIRNAVILAGILCLFMFALAYLGIANDPDTGVPDAAPAMTQYLPPLNCLQVCRFWFLPASCCPLLLLALIRIKQ